MRFLGHERQSHYLNKFHTFDTGSSDAFKRIYQLAHHPQGLGWHIILAYVEAAKHPPLLPLVIENFSLQVLLSKARRRKDQSVIDTIKERLEDFHVATEAFVTGRPIEEVAKKRQEDVLAKTKHELPFDPATLPERLEFSEEEHQLKKSSVRILTKVFQKMRASLMRRFPEQQPEKSSETKPQQA
jgi:hypothetical protein